MTDNLPDFEDLRHLGKTGRSYLISGDGRNRKYGFRSCVSCKLGDIEQSEWQQMMRDLIHRSGEDKLFDQMLTWLKEHNYCSDTEKQLESKASELHSMRILENAAWVDFIKFNQRFRPQILDGIPIAYVRTECCNELFITTQALLKNAHNGTTCCQICGRWSPFVILDTDTYTAFMLPEELED